MTETGRHILRRNLSLWQVVLYGLGTTIGAGIYLLLGEVARLSGSAAPTAFLVSSLLAIFTALSFGELVSRFPRSAGTATYVREGFGRRHLATAIGLMVSTAGCISAAAMANGFASYLSEFVEIPQGICIAAFVILMVAVAAWGVSESVTLAGLITLIEIGGLVVIIWVAGDSLNQVPERWTELLPVFDVRAWHGISAASLLTFYAYLGFEDMVTVAEEVKEARRTLPLAIGITLGVTTLLYVTLAAVSVLSVSPEELSESAVPLAFLYERATGNSPTGIATVGVLAVVNGALIQVIMASRVLYGLAAQGHLPAWLAKVHRKTGTPHYATMAAGALVLVLALWFPLATLAEGTSVLTLLVFVMVNLALWRVKGRAEIQAAAFTVPRWVPIVGACSTGMLLFIRLSAALVG